MSHHLCFGNLDPSCLFFRSGLHRSCLFLDWRGWSSNVYLFSYYDFLSGLGVFMVGGILDLQLACNFLGMGWVFLPFSLSLLV